MYYTYDNCESIEVPAPFGRTITPMFMGDDKEITESNFSIHMTEWQPAVRWITTATKIPWRPCTASPAPA